MVLHLSDIDYDIDIDDELYHKCLECLFSDGFVEKDQSELQLNLELTLELQKIYMAKLDADSDLHSYKDYEEKYGKEDFVKAADDYLKSRVLEFKDKYVELAKNTIEKYIREKEIYDPSDSELTDEMRSTRAGAFVSIHKNGALRGCIGTIAPTCITVAEEIISNAIAASTRDPRFPAIVADELDSLEINVDVLTTPEPIGSEAELDVKRYGVIVEKGFKRGLLLPDLDGVDTVEYQIAIAKQKACIDIADTDVKLSRFEVIRHV